jgi:hypothetical protein
MTVVSMAKASGLSDRRGLPVAMREETRRSSHQRRITGVTRCLWPYRDSNVAKLARSGDTFLSHRSTL